MNVALLRRNGALRSLPLWGAPLLLNAILILGLVFSSAIRRRSPVSATALVAVGWLTVAAFLAFGPGRSRCRPFDLALPISARTLWLANVAAVGLAALALVACYAASVAVAARVFRASLAFEPDVPSLALNLSAATVLATILLHAPRPSLVRPSFTVGYAVWAGTIVFGMLGLLAALDGSGPMIGLGLLAASAGAVAIAYQSVPPAFAVVRRAPQGRRTPAPPASPARVAAAAGDEPRARGHGFLHRATRTFVFGLSGGWKLLLSYFFVVIVGLFVGGVTKGWVSEDGLNDLRFVYLPLGSYVLFTVILPQLAVLHHLDSLPLSRRRLFVGLTLPVALAFVAAFGAGALVATRSDARTEYVDFSRNERDGQWFLSAPLRVYRIAWDGRAPTITSPWGESHPPESAHFVRGLRPVIWNPFSAPPGASARFVALQISRAAEVVYGDAISPEAIENRWLETGADGAVVGRGEHLSLRAERPALTPRSGPVFPVVMALTLAPWLLLVAILLRTFRAGLGDRVRRAAFVGIVVVFMATMLAIFGAMVANVARPWLIRALIQIPAWGLRGSAIGIAAAWAICALLTFAAYRVAEVQFLRMEIPPKPLKLSLVELMSDGSH